MNMKLSQQLEGRCEQRRIDNFANSINQCDYDVDINYSGLGSRELLNDNLTHPIHSGRSGHASRRKLGVYEVFSDDIVIMVITLYQHGLATCEHRVMMTELDYKLFTAGLMRAIFVVALISWMAIIETFQLRTRL